MNGGSIATALMWLVIFGLIWFAAEAASLSPVTKGERIGWIVENVIIGIFVFGGALIFLFNPA